MKYKTRFDDGQAQRLTPHEWSTHAERAEAEARWTDAARLWHKAAGVTIGHSRATMYENRERAALDKMTGKQARSTAGKIAMRAKRDIAAFERACKAADKTDTGDAWDLLYQLRAKLGEIEAQS